MEDGLARKCDFCGGKCTVKVDMGMQLLNPKSATEEKIMKRNPKCRVSYHLQVSIRTFACHLLTSRHSSSSKLSCKAVVGYNMQEGNMRLQVNLNAWNENDRKASSPFASK
jgi:hypothetical protein